MTYAISYDFDELWLGDLGGCVCADGTAEISFDGESWWVSEITYHRHDNSRSPLHSVVDKIESGHPLYAMIVNALEKHCGEAINDAVALEMAENGMGATVGYDRLGARQLGIGKYNR